MLSAHPPGRGSGTGLRGLVTLEALRRCAETVDVVALAGADEIAFGDHAVRIVRRPPDASAVRRAAALRYGSSYYTAEREAKFTARIRQLIAAGELRPGYEVVWSCQSLMARPALEAVQASVRVLDIDNIAGAERRKSAEAPGLSPPKRLYRRVSGVVLARAERRWCNRFHQVVVPSALERERLQRVGVPVAIVPNTVECGTRVSPEAAAERLLFVGSLDYAPNIDAVGWLVDEIVPHIRLVAPGAKITVAGRSPTQKVVALCARGGIDLLQNVADLDPLYAASRVVVAPMRFGGGTRFKILEAMCRGAAVVTTPVGGEGIQLVDGVNALVAGGAHDFAERCLQLLRDPVEANRIGGAAHDTWSAHYRPEVAEREIVSLIERLAPA